ncbi:MAG: ABC transporter substrate-binding protein [Clostridia bacterium]|nr:ABC transporter substrate-binding protein [Clostridia bacterium]
MKKIWMAAMAALLVLLTVACAAAEPAQVYALKGPTGIGMVGVMQDHPDEYEFTLCGAADEIVAAIASGSADIAACPTNLAATLYQKTSGGVRLLALNTLGVLHVVTSDADIDSIDDLAGRTVYATGQASVPEYVIDYILKQNGLTDSVTIEYVAEHSELATMLAAGQAEIGILPEPHVTSALMQNDQLRAALDVTALFEDAARQAGNEDMVLSMGCVIVRTAYAEEHPDQVAAFLDAYAASVEFVNSDPEAASQQVEAFGVMPKAAVALRAIPNCHIVFVDGEAMRAQIEPLYELLFEANPASIGGALPDDAFYYAR